MEDKALQELLERLQGEIEKTQSLDEKGRELLRRLDADIHELLERSGGRSDESVLRRLRDGIDHFEVTHPTLTAMLSQILNSLSNAGI